MRLTVQPPKPDALRDTVFLFDGETLIRPVPAIVCLDPQVVTSLLDEKLTPGSMWSRLSQLETAVARSSVIDLPTIAIRKSSRGVLVIQLLDGQHRAAMYFKLNARNAPYLTESRMVQPLLAACGASSQLARQDFDFSQIPPDIRIFP